MTRRPSSESRFHPRANTGAPSGGRTRGRRPERADAEPHRDRQRPSLASRRAFLLLLSVLLIALFFAIPLNRSWLYDKVIDRGNIVHQFGRLALADRMESRYDDSYRGYLAIKEFLRDKEGAVVLFPPQNLLTQQKLTKFVVPEPAVFYYYTGLRSVWANSRTVTQATHAMVVTESGQIGLKPISNRQQLDMLVAMYTPYLK